MNSPETDPKIYPISAVINGGASTAGPTYDIIDMRTQKMILATQNTYKELLPVLDKLNTELEAGVYEDADTSLADAALLLVLEVNTPVVAMQVAAMTSDPQVEQVSARTKQVRAPASLAFVPPIEPLQKL